ncbi:MAG: TonB family protein [Halieaceae bacterium]|jgi:TonB family protein
MRDWYTLGQLTLLPLAATLAVHLAILGAIVWRWEPDSATRTIEARVMTPAIINATLIDAASLRKKPVQRQPKANTAKAPPKKPAASAKPQPSASVATSESAPVKTRSEEAKPKTPEVAPEPAEKRISVQELAAISRAELADALEAESATQGAVTAEEMAASYAGLIRATVVSYWSRPPSARNGMEALLAIQLVPTGEIVSVSVIRSSGSTPFDRSAMNAVEKAGSFPELRNLPDREFEKTFRRFQLLFRPEDLRY